MHTDVMARLGALAAERAARDPNFQKEAVFRALGAALGHARNFLGAAGGAARAVPGAVAGGARSVGGAASGFVGRARAAMGQGYQSARPPVAPPAPPAGGVPGNPFGNQVPGGRAVPAPGAGAAPAPRPGMGLPGKLALGGGAVGAAGTGGAYAAADTDHIGGLSGNVEGLERMRGDYQKQIDDLKAGGGGWWRGGSQADRDSRIKAMEENLRSGNFGGGLFDGRTFAQRRQQAQSQSDVLAKGGQGQGGLANRLFGYRDQAAVDAGMSRFDGDEMAKRFAALGITGPRGRRPAATPTRPGSPIGTGATNWDNYRATFHNPYGGRDWSHLLRSHPANAATGGGAAPAPG